MTAAEVVQSNYKEFVSVEGLAGADHVVPPADVLGFVGVISGDVVMPGQGVTNQDGVGLVRVQLAIRFIHQFITRQHRTALKLQRSVELCALRADDTYRRNHVNPQNKKPVQLRARAGSLALAGMFNVPRKLNQIGTGGSFRVLHTAVNLAGCNVE